MQLDEPSGQGQANELMMLLDYQEDLSLKLPHPKVENMDSDERVETVKISSLEENRESKVKIQIGTLSPFKGFGEGTYKMSDAKRMTAKPDFLKMSFEDRKCEVELYEDCRTRKLLEKCNCVPWKLPSRQVKRH